MRIKEAVSTIQEENTAGRELIEQQTTPHSTELHFLLKGQGI